MGILNSFFKKSKPKYELFGNPQPACPYCLKSLDVMPGRKKKCPYCGSYMYVRTRPADRRRVIVTEEDAAKIDQQWMMEHGTYNTYLADKEEFENEKASLAKKFGREPLDNDVYWSLFNKQLVNHMKNGDWGLYRNTRFSMAELLIRENKLRPALDTFIEVSYLDANGPRNMGGMFEPQVVDKFPPFNRQNAFQAPAIVHSIAKLAKSLGMDEAVQKAVFIEVANRLHKSMKLPVTPGQGWSDLYREFVKLER